MTPDTSEPELSENKGSFVKTLDDCNFHMKKNRCEIKSIPLVI